MPASQTASSGATPSPRCRCRRAGPLWALLSRWGRARAGGGVGRRRRRRHSQQGVRLLPPRMLNGGAHLAEPNVEQCARRGCTPRVGLFAGCSQAEQGCSKRAAAASAFPGTHSQCRKRGARNRAWWMWARRRQPVQGRQRAKRLLLALAFASAALQPGGTVYHSSMSHAAAVRCSMALHGALRGQRSTFGERRRRRRRAA